ncbi:MAG: 2-amino-4-hydroxy-6-hydroxymethyldihydropteridine diphosphokinase [Bacteroidota bacterium]|nr:2-amino-4-hydroxy-6-hydroxymethyldihydropteridine diphosphokinase [Bacteroidota bacterium]
MDPVSCILLLGSNRGDRLKMLEKARQAIDSEAGRIHKVSQIYESEPWGFMDPEDFLNQAVEILTEKEPLELLDTIQHIEASLGRVRTSEHYEGRTLDIDILFYDELILDSPRLTIPHPRIQERRFVLLPLADLGEEKIHPALTQTIRQLLVNCSDKSRVNLFKIS